MSMLELTGHEEFLGWAAVRHLLFCCQHCHLSYFLVSRTRTLYSMLMTSRQHFV